MKKIYTTQKLKETLIKEFDELVWIDEKKKIGRKKNKIIYPLSSLIYWCQKIYTGYYKHNTYGGYHSIHYKTLEGWFGQDYHNIVSILLESPLGWKKGSHTKGWRLRKKTEKVLDDYYSKISRQRRYNTLLNLDGKRITKLDPAGITKTSTMGKKVSKEERFENNINSVVKVNFDNIQNGIDLIRQYLDTNKIDSFNKNKWTNKLFYEEHPIHTRTPDSLVERWRTLLLLREMSDNEVLNKGYIYKHYYYNKTGRVYTDGNISIQNMYSDLRDIVFGGLGCWDYDISNCHYTIMKQLMHYYNIKGGDSFQYYIDNKKQIRKTLSLKLGVSESKVKSVIISILYGSQKTINENCEITKILGQDKHRELLKDAFIQQLFDDRETLTDNIIKITEKEPKQHQYLQICGARKPYYKNIRNRRLLFTDSNGKKTPRRKILGHLLQGLESKILDIIIGEVGRDKIKVLIHDGFICDGRIDENKVITAVHNELQIEIEFDKKPLDCKLKKPIL